MQPPWAPSLICSITQAAGLESLHVVRWYMWGSKTHRHAPVKAGSVPEMSLTKYQLMFQSLCSLQFDEHFYKWMYSLRSVEFSSVQIKH